MIVAVHSFVFDYGNTGNLYRIVVQGVKAEILRYLQGFSNDVRWYKSSKKLHRNEKGNRRVPCGTIVACSFDRDKVTKFGHRKTTLVDERHALCTTG